MESIRIIERLLYQNYIVQFQKEERGQIWLQPVPTNIYCTVHPPTQRISFYMARFYSKKKTHNAATFILYAVLQANLGRFDDCSFTFGIWCKLCSLQLSCPNSNKICLGTNTYKQIHHNIVSHLQLFLLLISYPLTNHDTSTAWIKIVFIYALLNQQTSATRD